MKYFQLTDHIFVYNEIILWYKDAQFKEEHLPVRLFSTLVNSLAAGICGHNFKCIIFEHKL